MFNKSIDIINIKKHRIEDRDGSPLAYITYKYISEGFVSTDDIYIKLNDFNLPSYYYDSSIERSVDSIIKFEKNIFDKKIKKKLKIHIKDKLLKIEYENRINKFNLK